MSTQNAQYRDNLPPARVDITERAAWRGSGGASLIVAIVLTLAGTLLCIFAGVKMENGDSSVLVVASLVIGSVAVLIAFLLFSCLTIVAPGETKVIQFFGRYIGTIRRPGLSLVVPFSSRLKMIVRVRNFETNELKVNDFDGNPINIGAIVVWQVADTAKAAFAVENVVDFVHIQSESALRHVAMSHPYDGNESDEAGPTLRGSTDRISDELATEVSERVAVAGVEVIEVRISQLAYAPEIAQAMLQRQQASAVIAAREKIVEGAVSMVETALARLEEEDVVSLDEERRAAMVSNLLVVLCSESRTTPVLNTGSLYS